MDRIVLSRNGRATGIIAYVLPKATMQAVEHDYRQNSRDRHQQPSFFEVPNFGTLGAGVKDEENFRSICARLLPHRLSPITHDGSSMRLQPAKFPLFAQVLRR